MQSKVDQVIEPIQVESTSRSRYISGEGIGGRAWVVDRARYEANKVMDGKRMTDSMQNKAGQI